MKGYSRSIRLPALSIASAIFPSLLWIISRINSISTTAFMSKVHFSIAFINSLTTLPQVPALCYTPPFLRAACGDSTHRTAPPFHSAVGLLPNSGVWGAAPLQNTSRSRSGRNWVVGDSQRGKKPIPFRERCAPALLAALQWREPPCMCCLQSCPCLLTGAAAASRCAQRRCQPNRAMSPSVVTCLRMHHT